MKMKQSTFALAHSIAILSLASLGCGMYSTASPSEGSQATIGTGPDLSVEGKSTIDVGNGLLVVNFDVAGELLRGIGLEDLDLTDVTQLNVGGVEILNGACVLSPALLNILNSGVLLKIKAEHPNLSVVLSLGGQSNFDELTNQILLPELRLALAESTISLMGKYGFVGIDLNFDQIPQGEGSCTCGAGNGDALRGFLEILRLQLDAQEEANDATYLLSLQVSSDPSVIATLDLGAIHPYVDHLDVKAFGLNGTWEKITNLAAPLHSCKDDPSADKESHTVAAILDLYLAAGVPSKKLVLGVAFDGYGWLGVGPAGNGLYQPSLGAVAGLQVAGLVDYSQIMATIGLKTFWSDEAQAPWAYSAAGLMFTYENEQSLTAKIDYASKLDLGGIMIREGGCDGKAQPLLHAVANRLRP